MGTLSSFLDLKIIKLSQCMRSRIEQIQAYWQWMLFLDTFGRSLTTELWAIHSSAVLAFKTCLVRIFCKCRNPMYVFIERIPLVWHTQWDFVIYIAKCFILGCCDNEKETYPGIWSRQEKNSTKTVQQHHLIVSGRF